MVVPPLLRNEDDYNAPKDLFDFRARGRLYKMASFVESCRKIKFLTVLTRRPTAQKEAGVIESPASIYLKVSAAAKERDPGRIWVVGK
jgi:hypothetical protein